VGAYSAGRSRPPFWTGLLLDLGRRLVPRAWRREVAAWDMFERGLRAGRL
jgi:hypothetical protein